MSQKILPKSFTNFFISAADKATVSDVTIADDAPQRAHVPCGTCRGLLEPRQPVPLQLGSDQWLQVTHDQTGQSHPPDGSARLSDPGRGKRIRRSNLHSLHGRVDRLRRGAIRQCQEPQPIT